MRLHMALACTLLYAAAGIAITDVPLSNPGFEEYDTLDGFECWPTGWKILGDRTDVYELKSDTTTSQSGNASGRISVIAEGRTGYCCHVDQRLPQDLVDIMPGEEVAFGGWVKSSSSDLLFNLQMVLQLAHVDSNGWQQLGWVSEPCGTSTEWHYVTDTTSIGANVNRVVMTLYIKPLQAVGTTFWADDLSVTIVSTGVTYHVSGARNAGRTGTGPIRAFAPNGRALDIAAPHGLAPGLRLLQHKHKTVTPMVLP